ncbi:Coq4 family protein [Parahaliea mediterranea]|uniref:Coq4 family protein n=1 Tax=Parahaliea mediterranea TaxID=651086 RepID=UPI000E2F4955|nr:Coq4 family protein [Parahaliea mediterranea]
MMTNWWNNRVQPLAALAAMRRLIANPDATGEVFRIIEALKGDSLQRAVVRLGQSETGRTLLAQRPDIVTRLSDRDYLRSLPAGSLGWHYLQFVESQQLSADGLVAASDEAPGRRRLPADQQWLGARLRDIHDLQHVLTGYGRDELGELCLLSFMTGQTHNRGINFIVFMGRRQFRRQAPEIDVDACVAEGAELARRCRWLPALPLEDYLPQPLDSLRREWALEPPRRYLAARALLDGAGMTGVATVAPVPQ